MFIVARVVSAGGDCQLDVKVGTRPATIFLYVDDLQQKLTIRLTDGSGTVIDKHDLHKGGPIAAEISCTKNMQRKTISKVSERLLARDITKRFLRTQLRIASLIRPRNPHLSILILHFIHRLTCKSTSAHPTFFEASMIKQINHRLGGTESVYAIPTLPMQKLKDKLETSFSAAKHHHDQFRLYRDSQDTGARSEGVHAFATMIKALADGQHYLLNEATKEWKGRNAALQTAKKKAKV